MQSFFDVTEHTGILIPMYGTLHMITLFLMLAFIPLMIWRRKVIRNFMSNRKNMVRFMAIYLSIDVFYWAMVWYFKYEPMYERFPLHLCATLSIVMPLFILTEKYNWFRFFMYWSVCAGFISLVNPAFIHDAPWSFAFIQYLIRHYFLFLFPIFVFIGKEFEISYREFLLSSAALAGYAFLIFLLNWATGANYMHLGQHNPLEIPFLPVSFTTWPWSYPSFVGVGIILLHLVYISFRFSQKKEKKA